MSVFISRICKQTDINFLYYLIYENFFRIIAYIN